MIYKMFYINTDIEQALSLTNLCEEELLSIVGKYAAHSKRAGLYRGKVVEYVNGTVEIRTAFGNKLLWRQDENCESDLFEERV